MRGKKVLLGLILALGAGTAEAKGKITLEAARDAEHSLLWQEALDDYQALYEGSKDPHFLREIANCQVHLGLKEEGAKTYAAYADQFPEDSSVAAYLAKSKETPVPTPIPGVDGVTVFMKDNPRDQKHFQITVEMLTPLILGLDLAYYRDRHHDFGLGWVGAGTGSASGALYHPRYRYHRARFYWDSFFELGGLMGGYRTEGTRGDYTQLSVLGGDFGIGTDYKSDGPWTFSFLLSFNFLSATSRERYTNTSTYYTGGYYNYQWDPTCPCYNYVYIPMTSTTTSTVREDVYNAIVAYPLIGMSYGFIF